MCATGGCAWAQTVWSLQLKKSERPEVSEMPVSPEVRSKLCSSRFLWLDMGSPGRPVMTGKRLEKCVGGVVVVVGSAVTSERDSGKKPWSNADGFPHFSCEDAGVEFSELPSSPNELNDSCWFSYHSSAC